MNSRPALWLIVACAVALSASGCAATPATPAAPLPTFTPRAVASPSPTPEGAPFIPTLTPVPLGNLPGALITYRFDVALDYIGHRAIVDEVIEAVNPGPDTWQQLVFQLPYALRTSAFNLTSITQTQGADTVNAAYQQAGNVLRVLVPGGVPPSAAAVVTISYGLSVPPGTADTQLPRGNVAYSDQIIQFVNWYPILVPYGAGSGWATIAPAAGDPLPADPVFAETADYELAVTTPDNVVVVSGGPRQHRQGRWSFAIKNARTVAFAASPHYATLSQTEGGVMVDSYFLPEHKAAGQAALIAAAQSLSLFAERFGVYPYRSLVIAEDAVFGSAVGGGVVLHTGRGYADYNGRPDSLLVTLVPQSVARLWWGQVVSGDPFAQPWLNESLPMYAELLYDQAFYPDLELWYWDSRVDYWQPTGALDRAVTDFADTEAYLRNLLRRGAQFLRDVRAAVGDDAFFAFVQDYYRNGAYRIVSNADFFNALGRHSAVNLDPVVAAYFAHQLMPTPAPTLTPAPTAGPPAPTPVIHVVRSGETLTRIAQAYGVTVEAVVQANHLANADSIYVGQKLIIPPP